MKEIIRKFIHSLMSGSRQFQQHRYHPKVFLFGEIKVAPMLTFARVSFFLVVDVKKYLVVASWENGSNR